MHYPTSLVEVLQLELFLQVFEGFLGSHLFQDVLFNADGVHRLGVLVRGEADLSDTFFHLFLVVDLSQLEDFGLEELLFQDFVKGGEQFEHLGGGEFVRSHPETEAVDEDAGHVVCVFPAEEAEVEGEEGVIGLLEEEGEKGAGLLVRPVDGVQIGLKECLEMSFADKLVALGGDFLLSFWEHVRDVQDSTHELKCSEENLHEQIALLRRRVFIMRGEQVHRCRLLLLYLSNDAPLLLFSYHEFSLEDCMGQVSEQSLKLRDIVQFMQIHLVELRLYSSFRVFEDEGYLVVEALPDDEHGLIKLAGGLQSLEFL